jgi:cytochrome P450
MGGKRVPYVLGADDNMLDPDPRVAQALMDRLRAQGHEVVTDDAGMVVWFSTTDDAEHLLTAPEFSAGVAMAMLHLSGVHEGPLYELWSDLMFGKDGDDHKRIRQSVARRFTPKAVGRLRPTVERISDELLSSWPPGSIVDVWESFAVPLPARSACARWSASPTTTQAASPSGHSSSYGPSGCSTPTPSTPPTQQPPSWSRTSTS